MNLVWTLAGIPASLGILSLCRSVSTNEMVPVVDVHANFLRGFKQNLVLRKLSRKIKTQPILNKAVRIAIVSIFTVASGLGLHAQQSMASSVASIQDSTLKFQAALKMPVENLDTASSSSTSSADTTDAVFVERSALSDFVQPPPRRRYGRPNYTDNHQNADGSNKYTFLIGGGLTLPTGGTHNDLTTSYNIQGGVGRNFNKKVGLIAQFDRANFGIQNNTLNNLLTTYNSVGAVDQNGNSLSQLGGSSHVWSFTLNPIYSFAQSDKTGAYVVGGLGFYHKTANFTIPAVGTYCDYYYGCYQYQANQSIDKYTSNAFGVNAGVGLTYKLSHFASARVYVEARYVFVDNQPRPYSLGSATSTYFNVFPQNSARTTYIPITLGIRF
jgi:hypothetical protein